MIAFDAHPHSGSLAVYLHWKGGIASVLATNGRLHEAVYQAIIAD